MFKKIAALIILLLIAGGGWFILNRNRQAATQTVPQVHYHAGFKVYQNNQVLDFSKPEFMHVDPCGGEEKHTDKTAADRAHLHDLMGDVVHVHSSRATWGDLWENLHFEPRGKIEYYLNGQKMGDLSQTIIQPYDRLLLLVGDNTDIQQKLESVPTIDAIKQAESKTETC